MTDKGYEMAQKHFLQQIRQYNKKHTAIKKQPSSKIFQR